MIAHESASKKFQTTPTLGQTAPIFERSTLLRLDFLHKRTNGKSSRADLTHTHTHTHTASKCVVCFNPQEVLHQGGQHGAAVPVLHWSSTFFFNLTPYDSIPLSNEGDNFIADLYSQYDCSGCCAVYM